MSYKILLKSTHPAPLLMSVSYQEKKHTPEYTTASDKQIPLWEL